MRVSVVAVLILVPLFSWAGQTEPFAGIEVMPSPGPESEVLKLDEGTWEATIQSWTSPGSQPFVDKAVEVNRTISGGLWLVSDLKGTMLDKRYEGHGIYGFDPQKKKYTGVWVDSLQNYLAMWEGTYDPASKTLTQWAETPDYLGRKIRWRSVMEYKGKDLRIWKSFSNAGGGSEFVSTVITYKRRK